MICPIQERSIANAIAGKANFACRSFEAESLKQRLDPNWLLGTVAIGSFNHDTMVLRNSVPRRKDGIEAESMAYFESVKLHCRRREDKVMTITSVAFDHRFRTVRNPSRYNPVREAGCKLAQLFRRKVATQEKAKSKLFQSFA
jgi:hypothetical protein